MNRLKKLILPVKIFAAWVLANVLTILTWITLYPLLEWANIINHPSQHPYWLVPVLVVYLIASLNWLFNFKHMYYQWVQWRFWTKKHRGK